jgi:hypothetical protein
VLNTVEQILQTYKAKLDMISTHYLVLKMNIVETFQAQCQKMTPSSPKRNRSSNIGFGDLSNFKVTLENYKTISPLKSDTVGNTEDVNPHADYPDFEFTAEYIQKFLSELKTKVEDRILNLDKVEQLIPKIGKKFQLLHHIFEMLRSLGKSFTTEYSSKFRDIWNNTLVEIGMEAKPQAG